MMKRIALAVFYLFLLTADAHAARGLFISTSATCADVPSPEADLTYCLPSTGSNKNKLLVYNGSAFVLSPGANSESDPIVGAITGIVKADGAGNISAATAGTDYYAPGGTDVAVADGGTGASSASGARTNLGVVIGTDVAAAPSGSANTPLFNNGSGGFTNGTRSGNTTKVVTMGAGTPSTDDCAKWDANGNIISAGAACGSGGGGSPGGSDTQVQFNDGGSFGGDAGLTYDKTTNTLTADAFVGALTGNASTATALASNPTDCSSDQYANAIAASGNLTCSAVTDAQLSTSDITTNNVSTSKHGFAPKLPNDATKYLDGTGAYSVPAGGGGSGALTLVEHKTVTSNSTTVTFSTGIDGNTDGIYRLIWKIKNVSGATPNYFWHPTGVSTNLHSRKGYTNTTDGTFTSNTHTDLILGFASANNTWFSGSIDIYPRKSAHSVGAPMTYSGTSFNWDGTVNWVFMIGGEWTETSTNLTSIDVTAASSNGIGDGSELWLYKLAQ